MGALSGKEGPLGFSMASYPVVNTPATAVGDFLEELQAAFILLKRR